MPPTKPEKPQPTFENALDRINTVGMACLAGTATTNQAAILQETYHMVVDLKAHHQELVEALRDLSDFYVPTADLVFNQKMKKARAVLAQVETNK